MRKGGDMIGERMINLLETNNVPYECIMHDPAYTAQGTAEAAHISGKFIAKSVIIRIDGRLGMVVLPANYKLSLELLQKLTSSLDIEMVDEDEFKQLFSDCEVGAMPPFGNLYGMHVLVAKELTKDKEIIFNAGSHSELIKITYKDYARLVHPKVLDLIAMQP
jgi:Ala-tRNA(Pro) deacylase